jgi:cytoskeletal protein CcmA (bactofilin family)
VAKDEINAFLGTGTSYEGKLNFQGSVRIDGEFSGEVESEGTLVVGQDARITGRLKVGQLVLSGRLDGDVVATGKVILHKQAKFSGTLKTPVLIIEEGALLDGEISMAETHTRASLVRTEKQLESSSRMHQE